MAARKRMTVLDRLEAFKRGEVLVPERLARNGVTALTPGKPPKRNAKRPNHHRSPSRVGKRGRKVEQLTEDEVYRDTMAAHAAATAKAERERIEHDDRMTQALDDVAFEMVRGMPIGRAVVVCAKRHSVDRHQLLTQAETQQTRYSACENRTPPT